MARLIGEIADTAPKRQAEFRERKQRFEFRTFRKDEFEFALSDGWEHVRENKTSHRFRKLKPLDERFENEVSKALPLCGELQADCRFLGCRADHAKRLRSLKDLRRTALIVY